MYCEKLTATFDILTLEAQAGVAFLMPSSLSLPFSLILSVASLCRNLIYFASKLNRIAMTTVAFK